MQAATRQEQKAATRDRLVDAAMALFARKGIAQTTTADIARSIRMSHGVVFLHFPKRDDLVIAVIDEFGRRLAVEFRQALEQDLGLRAVLQAHLRVLAEFEPFYARLVIEAPLLPPKVRSTLLMLHAAVSQRLFLALGDVTRAYCRHCTDARGELLPYEQVLETNARYYVQSQGITPDAATRLAQALLADMPAWRGRH